MIFNKQTRLHKGFDSPKDRGNCYPTVISCIMELPVEEVFQLQEFYDTVWYEPLLEWLNSRGYDLENLDGHKFDDEPYFVSGTSPRNPDVSHITIYRNGKMIHDPHPDNQGILTENYFERLVKICQ